MLLSLVFWRQAFSLYDQRSVAPGGERGARSSEPSGASGNISQIVLDHCIPAGCIYNFRMVLTNDERGHDPLFCTVLSQFIWLAKGGLP